MNLPYRIIEPDPKGERSPKKDEVYVMKFALDTNMFDELFRILIPRYPEAKDMGQVWASAIQEVMLLQASGVKRYKGGDPKKILPPPPPKPYQQARSSPAEAMDPRD